MNEGVFEVLATPPQLGRLLRAADLKPGAEAMVVLTYGFWRSRFRADPSAVGRTMLVDGSPHTIIGVLPKSFARFNKEEIYAPILLMGPALDGNYRAVKQDTYGWRTTS